MRGRPYRKGGPRRTAVPLIAVLILFGVFATALGLGQVLGLPLPSFSLNFGRTDSSAMRPSQPTRISIPALGLRATVVEVGTAADGSIAPPAEDPSGTAGWYGLGPSPGEAGTAVIVGHVDTADKPAVFQRLRDLTAGRLVEVTRKDRRVATFTVDSVESFPKTAFPADRVFAPADVPRLALVTCGGAWVGGEVGYADNVIVFAHLA
jgi:hypothetical protein